MYIYVYTYIYIYKYTLTVYKYTLTYAFMFTCMMFHIYNGLQKNMFMIICMCALISCVYQRTAWTYGVAKVRAAAATPVAITVLLDTPSAVACSEHTEDTGAHDRRARLGALRLNAVAACSMQRPANIVHGLCWIYADMCVCVWVYINNSLQHKASKSCFRSQ